MSLLSILEKTKSLTPSGWTGTWARIWFQPSIFSAQKFIVGVIAMKDAQLHDFRLLSDTRKFACVYDKKTREIVDHILDDTRNLLFTLRANQGVIGQILLPPGLSLEPVGFVSGNTPYDVLDEATSDGEIPMEYVAELVKEKPQRFKEKNAVEIYESVIAAVRVKSSRGRVELVTDSFGDDTHKETVNLVLDDRTGMIANGWFSKPDQVVLEMYKAASSVESYMAMNNRSGTPAVFMLRPTLEDGLRQSQSTAIEEALELAEWKLEKKGMRIVTDNHEEFLADEIISWAYHSA